MKNFYFLEKKKKELITNRLQKSLKILKLLDGNLFMKKKMLLDLKEINNKLQPNQDYNMNSLELH